MNFLDFNLNPDIIKGILALGYETPTPIQAQTIPLLMQDKDVIGCAQTGTGKTAAFALPILNRIQPGSRKPQALIVTPTRELAEQIDRNIKEYSQFMDVRCLAVYGGVGLVPQEQQLRKGIDILVATPGRLLDHLQRRNVFLDEINVLVLDEADRMLDMGFMPDIRRIVRLVPQERQTLLFSATMPPEIESLARSITREAQIVQAGVRNATADGVKQHIFAVSKLDKMSLLLHLLDTQEIESAIVFSRTKHGADRIARNLSRKSVSVTCIHSDRSQAQRQQALEGFRNGHYQILVATDIASRGLDIPRVSHIINYDTPTHAEDYVHRIGRTGRASATGEAWTFTCMEEVKHLRDIEKLLKRSLPLTSPDVPAPVGLQAAQARVAQPVTRPVAQPTARVAQPAPKQPVRPEAPAQPAARVSQPAARPPVRPEARPAAQPPAVVQPVKEPVASRPGRAEETQPLRDDGKASITSLINYRDQKTARGLYQPLNEMDYIELDDPTDVIDLEAAPAPARRPARRRR